MRLPRASGVLLHPTSLPGPHGSGDLGPAAYHFVDWLRGAGQRLWQVLPLGVVGAGHSPYMSASAFAGNPLLVDLAELQQRGWLAADALDGAPAGDAQRVDFEHVGPWRQQRLAEAAQAFADHASAADRAAYADFCAAQADWLPDFALYMALAEHYGGDWCRWEAPLRHRTPDALAAARSALAPRLGYWQFGQWSFFRQWAALRAYANAQGVQLVGDVPIFVAQASADVWAHPGLFELDALGCPTVVAGVPPDYFSAEGQRWGNPLYRWPAHAADGYAWWTQRLRRTLAQVDIVRIDHFRGFADYWEIPAAQPTALHGRWRDGPGLALFDAMAAALGPLPVIAEDLGELSDAARALREASGFPGMAILQFAFGGDASAAYLPHNHHHHCVVYSGTHDNDTSVGWWAAASDHERHHARAYLGTDGHDIAWAMLRAAAASVANTAIHPMQDILALPGDCRMNRPGAATGCWTWRFDWSQVHGWHGHRLAELTRLYGRAPG